MMTTVLLYKSVLWKMIDHCRRELPREACGALFGTQERTSVKITDMLPIRNVAETPHRRFVMDPREWVPAVSQAKHGSRPIAGIFHSHPNTPAVPSEEDLRTTWRGFPCYVIISMLDPLRPTVKAYRLHDGEEATVGLRTATTKVPQGVYRELPVKITECHRPNANNG